MGFADSRSRELFRSYVQSGERTAEDPSLPELAARAQGPVCTFTRAELVEDRAWYGSAHVQELRRPGDSDDFIYSMHRSSGEPARVISLHRPWGERAFSERERQLVAVFHEECSFLHEPPGVPAARLKGLSPRLQETLRVLARGLSEKQIAAELGLSQYTVHDYVKTLHRHFGVASRSELLALCLTPG
ncbi:LuxR C-terminal-related transcriptional regulator [Polyangium sp. 15x6]|uniref:helix-turn-helix transcriptional regulator n=1 Tax=Polyangium sp. 15x6 TaxID=3042687 RepID=UPI00249B7AC8|nr:LuxR C-terminal-related transcriptional regulator [Polyangium sp. 15x6]MDI3283722.1 LuxR C-terminal-related transcriptional regulator [Polyangium sp. 15x6]